ncbi:MAG: undecaprenyldiphospho-muramoylpentapeptide beta-N-acetylglucosaminyltransferase [Acidobacteriia bacterium]|nr:undecaprenyldiphospho-muramoylpentapeptide beta-N-acetylglucosaminyltransferase [Terriglobia bacterium]
MESDRETRRILMVSGGTGGHIFPMLAVADELRSRSGRAAEAQPRYEIEFVGTKRPLESRLIPAAGYPLRTVAAAGLKGIGGLRKLRNFLVLPRTAVQTARLLREFKPHVVVGIGGYLAGPVMAEAALMDVPTLLMEPNARPGFTNRVLAPMVRIAAVGLEETANFYGAKAVVTGSPVRRAFAEIPPREHRPPFTVLLVGGSQGAQAINQAMIASLPLLESERARLRIIHQTGERDYNAVTQAYQGRGFAADVRTFIEDMPWALAQADLVVSRAGATAVAEFVAAGKAALLIPFPAATDQHQLENARVLEQAGAARVIEQKDLTPQCLVAAILEMLQDAAKLTRMEQCARQLAKPDAAARIADLIERLAISRQPSALSRNMLG